MRLNAKKLALFASAFGLIAGTSSSYAISVNGAASLQGTSSIGGMTAQDLDVVTGASENASLHASTPDDAREWSGSASASVNLETGEFKAFANIKKDSESAWLLQAEAGAYTDTTEIFVFSAASGGTDPINFSLTMNTSFEVFGTSSQYDIATATYEDPLSPSATGRLLNYFEIDECDDLACSQFGVQHQWNELQNFSELDDFSPYSSTRSIDLSIAPGTTKAYVVHIGFGAEVEATSQSQENYTFNGNHTGVLSADLPVEITMDSGAFFCIERSGTCDWVDVNHGRALHRRHSVKACE